MQTAKSIVEDKKNQISEIMKNVKGEMKKLGEIYKISSGGTPSRKEPSYWIDGNIPWLTTTEVTNGYITKTNEYITEEGSQIQRINKWLTEGRGWGGREIGEGD